MAQGAFLCDSNRLQLIYLNDTRICVIRQNKGGFLKLNYKGGIIIVNNPLRSQLIIVSCVILA